MAQHHLICYSRADATEFVDWLYDALSTCEPSFAVWLDRRDIRPGEDWDDQIDEALKTCRSVLFVMTEDSVDGIVYLSAAGSRGITVPYLHADLCKLLPDEKADDLDRLFADPRASAEAKMQALLAAFPQGRVVVLLDNFEDLVDPETREIRNAELAEALRALLTAPCHPVKAIITTRIVARDLALVEPGRQVHLGLDEGLASPFAENILREMDADGRLGLRDARAELLDEARRRTRGYPRALEALYGILAADRDTSLREVLDEARGLLPENVVEALVGEAFSRLDDAAQRVMEALAVYARPVPPVAVDYLLQPYLAGVDSAPVLGRLVNMQFVRKEAGRHYLHRIDHDYALARVPEGTEADRVDKDAPYTQFALHHRAANYFAETRKPRANWKTVDDLAPQLAEFEHRRAANEFDEAADILRTIDLAYLLVWGHFHTVMELHARVQDKIRGRRLRSDCLNALGMACRRVGRIHEAIAYYEEALALDREMGLHLRASTLLGNLGTCYYDIGQTQRAIEHTEQALAIAQKFSDRAGECLMFANLGIYYGNLGQTERAIDCTTRYFQFPGHGATRRFVGLAWRDLATALTDQGRYAEAIEAAQKGIRIGEEWKAPRVCSHNYRCLALACLCAGDLAAAREAAEATRQYDVPEANHACLAVLAVVALRQGDHATAQEAFSRAIREADAILAQTPDFYRALDAKALALAGLAICTGSGDLRAAADAFRAARAVNRDAGVVARVLRLLDALGPQGPDSPLAAVREAVAGE